MMKTNIGSIERILRIVIGLALVVATAMGQLPVWGYIGIVPLATGLMGWCPPYAIFGISTCKTKAAE